MRGLGKLGAIAIGLWFAFTAVATGQDAEDAGVVREATEQDVTLTVSVDKARLTVADQVEVKVTVVAPPEALINVPRISRQFGPFAELSQFEAGPIIQNDGRQYWERRYVLTPEYTGALTVPSQVIYYSYERIKSPSTACLLLRRCGNDSWTTERASPQQLNSEPIVVTVEAIVPEDANVMELQDVAPPVALERPRDWMWWGLVAALLLILAVLGGAYWLWRRRQAVDPSAEQPAGKPAHVLALAALTELSRSNLIDRGLIEEFHVRLSDILRGYVSWRFKVRAPHQTTEEFLAASLTTEGLNADQRDRVGRLLGVCDRVKFGRAQPGPEDMQAAYGRARTFVEQTADDSVLVTVTVPYPVP